MAVFTNGVTENPFFPDIQLLTVSGREQEEFHERAAHAARACFGRKVFLRAVVEVSNFCRENCSYCGMRRGNRQLVRYRTQVEELAGMLLERRPSHLTDINIQTGEDPLAIRQLVIPLISLLKRHTQLGVSVCLGTLDRGLYAELREAGASVYIMKFEMASEEDYRSFSAPGTLAERLRHIHHLAGQGWTVSSGFIAGLPGQTHSGLLANFQLASSLPLRGCSVSPFIPGDETPLAASPTADIGLTLNCMAALRLMRPDWVIPAVSALNLSQPNNGYARGLRTGANLVTINLTPPEVRRDYLLYKRDRFIMTEERVLQALDAEGLAVSEQSLAAFYQGRSTQGVNGHARPVAVAVT